MPITGWGENCPLFHQLLHVCLVWLNGQENIPIEKRQIRPQADRLEKLERSRELARNICGTVGIKPVTELVAKWWQLCTAAKLMSHRTPFQRALIPLHGMAPSPVLKPMTAICWQPYVFAREEFEATLDLLMDIFPENSEWKKDLASVMDDFMHVVELYPRRP